MARKEEPCSSRVCLVLLAAKNGKLNYMGHKEMTLCHSKGPEWGLIDMVPRACSCLLTLPPSGCWHCTPTARWLPLWCQEGCHSSRHHRHKTLKVPLLRLCVQGKETFLASFSQRLLSSWSSVTRSCLSLLQARMEPR